MAFFTLQITPFYAALLGMILVALSVRVILLRRSLKNQQDEKLLRAARGHANFTEYAPLFLILMLCAEINATSGFWLHAAGIAFTAGRIIHGATFALFKHDMRLRVGGMMLTLTALIVLIVLNILILV